MHVSNKRISQQHSIQFKMDSSSDEELLIAAAVLLIKERKKKTKKRRVWVQKIFRDRDRHGISSLHLQLIPP